MMETVRKILRILFVTAALLSFQGWVILGAYEVGLQDGKAVNRVVEKPQVDKKYLLQVTENK